MSVVPQLASDAESVRKGVSPHVFALKGWDGARAGYFLARERAYVTRLIQICEEEIVLIDDDIRNFAIPLPKTIDHKRSGIDIEVDVVDAPWFEPNQLHAADSRLAHTATSAKGQPMKRRTVCEYWASLHRAFQMVPVAKAALAAARPGPIIVVGAGARARALTLFTQTIGRAVVQLESAYGHAVHWIVPKVLARPANNSFVEWLSTDPVKRLEGAGALVFVDPHDAAVDLGSLFCMEDHAPPIILPAHTAPAALQAKLVGCDYVLVPQGTLWLGSHPGSEHPWPRITIVTVSFNHVRYLEQAMCSVLDQDYPNLEYIVVDGGSTDGSVDLINRYRPRLSHAIIEPDRGQSDALNKGFRLATGDIMNWLCSDDMLEPGSLRRIGDAYRRLRPDVVVGGCVRIGETRDEEILRHHSALPFGHVVSLPLEDMLQFMRSWQTANYFYQPEVFFSRRIWEASGAFVKRHLYYAMDYDLWLRMAMAGASVVHLPDIMGCSRVHEAQKTKTDRVYLHQLRQIMEEYRDILKRVAVLMD